MKFDKKKRTSERRNDCAKGGTPEKKPVDDGCEEFSKFRISSKTAKKLRERDITHLFPIQALTFDHIYDGLDVIGQARTGTGKTLSFVLPLCERFRKEKLSKVHGRPPTVLTLAPTRELALQIHKEFESVKNKRLVTCCVYGGVAYESQESAMRSGVDIIVGTPGRIHDHMTQGTLDLSKVRHVVLDEADRMMDMGFQEKVEEILKKPFEQENKPQMLLLSATMPKWVQDASKKYMSKDKKIVDLVGDTASKAATTVEHKAIRCSYRQRAATIADVIQVYSGAHGRAMIFTSTKKEANELALNSVLKQDTQVLHGDINQHQREITLKSFREGKFRCLVATDVAARGLDIPEVDLVVQCEPPKDVESYIHRSGRTGRAGRTGSSIVFYKPNQEDMLKEVERRAGFTFKRIGAPQPSDIIRASGNDAIRSLDGVSENMLALFRPVAEKLIAERGPVDTLAASLALLSGNTDMKSRSLLSSEEGFTTFMITQNLELRGTRLIWRMLNEDFPEDVAKSFRGMRLCKDRKSAVFDVPDSAKDDFMKTWKERHYASASIPTVLPELADQNSMYASQGNTNFRNGGNMNGNRGGSTGFRNGSRTHNGFRNQNGYRNQNGFKSQNNFKNGSSYGKNNSQLTGKKREFGESSENGKAKKIKIG